MNGLPNPCQARAADLYGRTPKRHDASQGYTHKSVMSLGSFEFCMLQGGAS
jgi:hypothetical protein